MWRAPPTRDAAAAAAFRIPFLNCTKCPSHARCGRRRRYDAFQMFDADGDGEIDEDEFSLLLEYVGLEVSDEKSERLFRKFDKDRSGSIGYEEFKRVWLKVGACGRAATRGGGGGATCVAARGRARRAREARREGEQVGRPVRRARARGCGAGALPVSARRCIALSHPAAQVHAVAPAGEGTPLPLARGRRGPACPSSESGSRVSHLPAHAGARGGGCRGAGGCPGVA